MMATPPSKRRGFKGSWFDLGRRGAFLYLLGALWVLIGALTIFTGTSPTLPDTLLHVMLAKEILGGAWIVTGLVSIFYAYRVDDAFGFLALYIVPSFIAFSFLLGWLDYLTPGFSAGYARGFQSMLIYVVFILLIVICAGWPEPPKPPSEVLKKDGDEE